MDESADLAGGYGEVSLRIEAANDRKGWRLHMSMLNIGSVVVELPDGDLVDEEKRIYFFDALQSLPYYVLHLIYGESLPREGDVLGGGLVMGVHTIPSNKDVS